MHKLKYSESLCAASKTHETWTVLNHNPLNLQVSLVMDNDQDMIVEEIPSHMYKNARTTFILQNPV